MEKELHSEYIRQITCQNRTNHSCWSEEAIYVHQEESVFFKHNRTHMNSYELTDMSNISSESSSSTTLMGTRRPGGIAGGLCPGSSVLIPRVSGAPNLCPANDVWPCSTMVFLAQPAHNTHTNHTLTNTMCVWSSFVCAKCPTRIVITTQCTYEN